MDYARRLGAAEVIDYRTSDFADVAGSGRRRDRHFGGSARERAVTVVKPGGILVTVVSTDFATMYWLRSAYRPSASADVAEAPGEDFAAQYSWRQSGNVGEVR